MTRKGGKGGKKALQRKWDREGREIADHGTTSHLLEAFQHLGEAYVRRGQRKL